MQTERDKMADTFMDMMFGSSPTKSRAKPLSMWEGKFMDYPVTIDAPPLIREKFLEALRIGRAYQLAREAKT
jgi:hypothetical protein